MITLSMFYGCLVLPEFFNFLKFLGQKEQIILECVLRQNNKTFLTSWTQKMSHAGHGWEGGRLPREMGMAEQQPGFLLQPFR